MIRIIFVAILIAGNAAAAEPDWGFEIESAHKGGFGEHEIYLRISPAPTADRATLKCFALVEGKAVDDDLEIISNLRDGSRAKLTFLKAAAGNMDELDCSLTIR